MSTGRRLARVMVGFGFAAAPGWMTATLVLTILNGVSAGLYPYGFRLFTDAFVDRDAAGLAVAVAATSGLIAVNWTSANFDANVGFGLVDRVNLYVSARLAELVNAAPGLEHLERPDYLRELDLVEQNRNLLASAPRQLLTALQTVLRAGGVLFLLATVHPALALLLVLGVAPTLAEMRSVRIRQAAEERVAEERRLGDQLFAVAATAASAKELRTFGLAEEIGRRHRMIGDHVTKVITRAALVGAGLAAAAWVAFIVGFVAAVAFLVRSAVRGEVTAGEVVLAIVLAQQVRVVLGLVATAAGQLLTTARTARRLLWLDDIVRDEPSGSGAVPEVLQDGIELRDVTFCYPGTDHVALSSVSLRLPRASTVALVGDNGAGKTTLVKLLTGMYRPTSGEVLVDGVPLPELDLAEWRRRLAGAFQDHVAFELRARHVVGVGDLPYLDDADVVEGALSRAAAGDVVAALTGGLDTRLGRSFDGGRDLSGGQWQKLALGRGMMREAPLLLVLDEPTAALDAATEHQLFERYRHASSRTAARTGGITLLVSHRFSTVRNADLIVVLAEGTVAEAGSHQDLLDRRGLYAEMFELQAASYR